MRFLTFFLLIGTYFALPAFGQSWDVLNGEQVFPVTARDGKLATAGYRPGMSGVEFFYAESVDQGMSWQYTAVNSAQNVQATPTCLQFFGDSLGFMGLKGSFTGEILKTTDAGTTWTSIHHTDIINQIYSSQILPAAASSFQPYDFTRLDDSSAIMVDFQQSSYLITSDRGTTWQWIENNRGADFPKVQHLANDDLLRAERTLLLRSSDRGSRWDTLFTSPGGKDLTTFDFVSPQDGFVMVGEPGSGIECWKTSTAGQSWQRVGSYSGASSFWDLHFSDTLKAWGLAGDKLYRTTDGGRSWTQPETLPFDAHQFEVVMGKLYAVGRGLAGYTGSISSLTADASLAIRLYPNPVQDVMYHDGPAGLSFQLWDEAGRQVMKGELPHKSLSLQGLPSGRYLMHIRDSKSEKTLSWRLVKE
jgi:photosystem II stability/assembly factor-like uncharacterized protein